MEDSAIVDLYWQRADSAISETSKKYGHYCHAIAYNYVRNNEDAEECVNDTWLTAWNSMPDKRPTVLSGFLAPIVRNLAVSMYRTKNSQKRGGGEVALALDELSECIADKSDVEQNYESKELSAAIGSFVAALPDSERKAFVARYWYMASIKEIAKGLHISEAKAKSLLYRTRCKMRVYLQEEGLC
jgi:RNA polymerase sigma-70 factor (ECF subfamily)